MRPGGLRFTIVIASWLSFCALAHSATVIEFYNAGLDHYFISATVAEIADLDSGKHPGWARTGLSFEASATSVAGQSPVCRFYIPPGYGDSHFYSASSQECSDTHTKFPFMTYESPSVFYIGLPNTSTGACPAGTTPVYRLWNNRGDSNHRYTTSLTVVSQMVARGYIREGYGPDAVIMCSGTAAGIDGFYVGITGQQQNIFVAVLDDGRMYVAYSAPSSATIVGVIIGTYAVTGGNYGVADARDYALGSGAFASLQVSGSYVPRVSISGVATYPGARTSTFSASYSSLYETPVSLSAAAGTYSGQIGSTAGTQGAVLTLSSTGAFTGATGGCVISGTAVPHGSTNVFDFTLTIGGDLCPSKGSISGAGFYDASTRTIYSLGTDAQRSDGYVFAGTK